MLYSYISRGRVRSCIRQWDLAKEDYLSVLQLFPASLEAKMGLEDLRDSKGEVSNDLPMLDSQVVNNSEKPYVDIWLWWCMSEVLLFRDIFIKYKLNNKFVSFPPQV